MQVCVIKEITGTYKAKIQKYKQATITVEKDDAIKIKVITWEGKKR